MSRAARSAELTSARSSLSAISMWPWTVFSQLLCTTFPARPRECDTSQLSVRVEFRLSEQILLGCVERERLQGTQSLSRRIDLEEEAMEDDVFTVGVLQVRGGRIHEPVHEVQVLVTHLDVPVLQRLAR
jgi:hypothetical protein